MDALGLGLFLAVARDYQEFLSAFKTNSKDKAPLVKPIVVILCGGRGARLQEHSSVLPKPLIEVGGRPIVWHVINMYLAHGFLPMAAQEWMAVCEYRPDARALLGLARVAERHGQHEDAAVFAAEALQHDPQNVAARELHARCSRATGPEVVLAAS